jgi:DNA excision repair protein ERCC-2
LICISIAEYYDENYATIFEKVNKDFRLKLFCVDPSSLMKEAMERCDSAVFYSATMIPVDYFRKIFGCDEYVGALVLASPFPQENLHILIADRISTLYKNRDKTKEEVAGAVCAMVNHRKGNYLIFFPSYQYLLKIFEIVSENFRDARIIIQERGMTEAQRDDFLQRFDEENDDSLVGFAVLGGVFGEGIDLVGDRLTGAAIIGVGLPGLSIEREIIKEYFGYHYGAGFEFAFMYPGINKVFQAAGRVIRSETDMGVVLLIDQRFREYRYKSLFPSEWTPVSVADMSEIEQELDDFWGNRV